MVAIGFPRVAVDEGLSAQREGVSLMVTSFPSKGVGRRIPVRVAKDQWWKSFKALWDVREEQARAYCGETRKPSFAAWPGGAGRVGMRPD